MQKVLILHLFLRSLLWPISSEEITKVCLQLPVRYSKIIYKKKKDKINKPRIKLILSEANFNNSEKPLIIWNIIIGIVYNLNI
jgi:uncharacterized protein with PQ loop repeat